jgi:DNA polymerase-3 subunit alpha
VNKKVLEALIKSGAFDDLHPKKNRAAMLAALDRAVDEAQKAARERSSGQTNLFGLMAAPQTSTAPAPPPYPDIEEFIPKQKLAFEKESLGFYITGHPLDRYVADLRRFGTTRTVDVQEKQDWEEVQVAGVVTAYRDLPLKSGDGRMALFQLEDTFGQVKVACFSKAFALYEEVLKSDEPILVSGKVKSGRAAPDAQDRGDGDEAKATRELNMSEAVLLSKMRAEKTRQMTVEVSADALTDERVEQLRTALSSYPGGVTTVLRVRVPMRSFTDCVLPPQFAVTPSDELLLRIERLFGENAARLR